MYLTDDYKDIIEIFNEFKVKYLISGAFAMSKLGYSRATYDIDLWVEKSQENAMKIYNALDEFGVPFKLKPDDFLESNSVIQIGNAPNRIDILTDIDGLNFEDAWNNKNKIDFNGLETYCLCLNDLIINKSSTNREKDKLDLVQLKQLSKLIQIKK